MPTKFFSGQEWGHIFQGWTDNCAVRQAFGTAFRFPDLIGIRKYLTEKRTFQFQDFIDKRRKEMPEGSYTTSLFKDGINRIAQKVGEEALEAVIEATNGSKEKLVYEAADMIYHLIVMLTSKGMRIEDIATELQKRHDPNWDKKRREAKAKGQME